MSSSSLAAFGFQPTLAQTNNAIASSYRQFDLLAQQSASRAGGQILAATGRNPVTSEVITNQNANAPPQYLESVREQANRACFIDKNPAMCSYWSQVYGTVDAARNAKAGEVDRFLTDAKKNGSLWKWFYNPTWVSSTPGTTAEAASVAVVLGQAPSLPPTV